MSDDLIRGPMPPINQEQGDRLIELLEQILSQLCDIENAINRIDR